MKTIVAVEITPLEQATVTPCELLEDFADTTPSWHYLEDDTSYYSALKGVPACVLRHVRATPFAATDYVFAASRKDVHGVVRLVLIDAGSSDDDEAHRKRDETVGDFVRTFRRYLDRRGMHARVDTVEQEADLAETA